MIDARGAVRLLDFGVAREADRRGRRGLTQPGLVIGTPEYMSPEQCQGETPDERSDIYSLGVVCYELFTGRVPFRGASTIDTVSLQLQQPPPLSEAIQLGLPRSMQEPLRAALAKDPDARPASARDFGRTLEGARAEASSELLERVVSIPSSERRRDRRLEIPIACQIRFAGSGGATREEQTVTENISRGGARIKTAQTHLVEGHRLDFEEVGGQFRVRAEVRGNRAGDDRTHRLHLKFVDHAAPDHLVGRSGGWEARAN